MKTILIVDGDGLLARSHFATGKDIFTKDNVEVGGVDKAIRVLMRQLDMWNAEYLFVAFDPWNRNTVRHREYAQYKANREPKPEGLVHSKKILMPILESMGAVIALDEDYEADDLVGAMVHRTSPANLVDDGETWQAVVSSHDKDLLGLTDYAHVVVSPPFQTETLRAKDVETKLGIVPARIMDYLALLGDSVDNIPGVDQCGKTRAAALLQKYGTLEAIVAAAQRGEIAKKLGDALRSQGNRAIAFRDVMRLRVDAPIPDPGTCGIGEVKYNQLLPLLLENNLMALHASGVANAKQAGFL